MTHIPKRILVLLLVLCILCTAMPVQAARMEPEGREIKYGTIQVLGVGQQHPAMYHAARDDENGLVYILAEDFAALTGATLSKSGQYDDWYYRYTLGGWNLRVCTQDGIGQVSYDFDPYEGDDVGYSLYDDFRMTDCLYDELNDCWYFPFEEMMYMMALQWQCFNGTVILYQPETLLDILAEYDIMAELLPTYSDLMGDDVWESWDNAWNYGFASAIDELDMNFIWDGVASGWHSAWGQDYYTGYEKDTMMQALLLLQSDRPSEEDAVSSGMEWVSDFIGAASTVLEHSTDGLGFDVSSQLMTDFLGVYLLPSEMEALSAEASTFSALMGYALSTAQAIWIRDQVSDDLADRLTFIQKAAEKRSEEDLFWETLAEVAGETREKYCGEISGAFKGLTADTVMTAMDGILSLDLGPDWKDTLTSDVADVLTDVAPDAAGTAIGTGASAVAAGLSILNWMNLTVGTLDLCVEVAKTSSPTFAGALERAENVHLCRYLIYMTSMLQSESSSSFQKLRACGGMSQKLLDNIRTGTYLMLVTSLHAHDRLSMLDKYLYPDIGFLEEEFMARLTESSKHDSLILMDSGFSDIVSSEPGSMRHDIPVEYVRIVEAIIVTTETFRTDGTHFSATITRPRVYSEANPNLTAAVDAVLDPIFNKKLSELDSSKAQAAACSMTYQTHTETAKLNAAYSNGGYLVLSVSNGFFSCSIGHNVLHTDIFVFDVASGALLGLSDLWDYNNNPNAEAEFIALMDAQLDAAGPRNDLSNRPSSLTARDIYLKSQEGRYVNWELTPEGIWFSIDKLNMNFTIGSILIPYDMLEGILKEEYMPLEVGSAANCQLTAFREEMREDHTLYENTPSVNALTVQGLANQIWIRDSYGSLPESIDGTCTYFYAFGLQNCIVTLPKPQYDQYGYAVMWQDSQGDHIQGFSANP